MVQMSVIIPTYNRASLLSQAIKSVLEQIYTDLELIVIDDASSDNTEETVHSFTDRRLCYIKQKHKGPSCARNEGIKSSCGEYIAFLDDDDLFLPGKLSSQVTKVVENPSAGLVYGLYLSSAGKESLFKTAGVCYQNLELKQLLLGPVFHWSTVMVQRSLLNDVGGFDETVCGEDWELTIRLALAGCRMVCVPEPVTLVRRQPISNTRDLGYMSSLLDVIDKVFRDPRMPLELMSLRNLADASQLIRIAATHFVTSKYESGREYLQQAFLTCPSLKDEHFDFLVDTLVYRIRGLAIYDSDVVLHQATKVLQGDLAFVKKLARQLWGKYYEIEAFQAFQLGHRADCAKNVILTFLKTPLRLNNRGLLSIFIRSMIGFNLGDPKKVSYPQLLD